MYELRNIYYLYFLPAANCPLLTVCILASLFMNKTLKAHLALFFAQVLYAASFPIAKIVMETIPYSALVILRVAGAVILFWTSSLIINEKVERKDFFRLFLLGIFGVAINQSLFLKGLHLTSPINAAIMMITTPILVLIIADRK